MSKENKSELDFENLLDESVKIHGHLCPGQVLGVRLSMLGLKLAGITDPKGKDRKNLVVYVEIDRCATDAIQSVTGCSLGKRSLKFLDFGKMAASFINLETGKAVRLLAKEESKDKAKNYIPDIEDKYKCQLEAYKIMPDEELFEWKEVKVSIPEEDMPGRPKRRIKCEKCGEFVQDNRDVSIEGKLLCKACAEGAYYKFL
ncbi:MAG TPA: formylmethanofuran dehydrogenase [Nitrospirae bacterium]|nr:FmdE, Molybdenum formylmethanofuran dehydrogenase operon [bacterium BMS3Abin06]HDH11625.1 formylmethanofuran dehydrogenase [Nitrospirota bacterium]HDZ02045.1 formylmethanofuran dehydrogenase [Nitrospirota bacterium]